MHVKSNAIVIVKDQALLGVGAGQPNRVTSVHLALRLAQQNIESLPGSGFVLASDAFFPFPDGVEMAAKGGVTAIIQPGGSIRDRESIKVADELNVAILAHTAAVKLKFGPIIPPFAIAYKTSYASSNNSYDTK